MLSLRWVAWLQKLSFKSVKPLILLKCRQAEHWNLTGSGKAALQQIWCPRGYEQAKKDFPYGINKAPHYCSAYSFICLLIKCVCTPPSLSILTPAPFGQSFPFHRHVKIKAATISRFPRFDWARHAQSIPEEVCEKLSNITLALTKRCECPDRGNDTGAIRLNDKQHSSSPFIPAWHWITWVCGEVCGCVCVCVCVILNDRMRRKKVGKEGASEMQS